MSPVDPPRTWRLLGPGGPYDGRTPGTLGGHRRSRIYGRLDCPSALRAIARGGYAGHRVFFADEKAAVSAGYRPCGVCLREEYALWKEHPTPRQRG
jgi:hypothetical protein